ncbi:hypothetical protein [Pedobacter agri]|uniref:hypothetical protein n=1 Tax=Pedobacter agri TaxID=454586 RepID=UPI00292DCB08|nr:hypothetical protein [Pedobacter agri]
MTETEEMSNNRNVRKGRHAREIINLTDFRSLPTESKFEAELKKTFILNYDGLRLTLAKHRLG